MSSPANRLRIEAAAVQQPAHRRALVERHRRAHLEHHAPEARRPGPPARPAAAASAPQPPPRRPPGPAPAGSARRASTPLSSTHAPTRAATGARRRTRSAQRREEGLDVGHRQHRAALGDLQAVVAAEGDARHGHQARASAAARPDTQPTSPKRATSRTSRPDASPPARPDRSGCGDDRRERAVDVEQDRRRAGVGRNGSRGSSGTRIRYAAMPRPLPAVVDLRGDRQRGGLLRGALRRRRRARHRAAADGLRALRGASGPRRRRSRPSSSRASTARRATSGRGTCTGPRPRAIGLPACAGVLAGHVAAAARLVRRADPALRGPHGRRRPAARDRRLTMDEAHLIAAALGVLAGVLAGLFGVGGGIVFVPALTLGVGLGSARRRGHVAGGDGPRRAARVATQQHRRGLVAWRPAIAIGLTSIGGVLVGRRRGRGPARGGPRAAVRRAPAGARRQDGASDARPDARASSGRERTRAPAEQALRAARCRGPGGDRRRGAGAGAVEPRKALLCFGEAGGRRRSRASRSPSPSA